MGTIPIIFVDIKSLVKAKDHGPFTDERILTKAQTTEVPSSLAGQKYDKDYKPFKSCNRSATILLINNNWTSYLLFRLY